MTTTTTIAEKIKSTFNIQPLNIGRGRQQSSQHVWQKLPPLKAADAAWSCLLLHHSYWNSFDTVVCLFLFRANELFIAPKTIENGF